MARAPLVDADVDLRDFPFMPLDVARLRDSGIATRASGDAFRAAVLLWCAAWHQVPCASLPDDDYEFAKLAGYGRDLRGWKKVRGDALRGWVKCDDGRFYHPVVAEKALEGWIEKLVQGKSSDAGNAKLYGHAFDPDAHDAAIEASKARLFALNPRSRILKKKGKRYAPGNPNGTKNTAENRPGGTPDRPPDGMPDECPAAVPTGSQETRKGQGQLKEDVWVGVRERVLAAFAQAGSPNIPDTSRVEIWRAQGRDPEICLAVVAELVRRKPSISTLGYFDKAIADAHVTPQGQARAGPAPRAAKPTHLSVLQEDLGHGPASHHFELDDRDAGDPSSNPSRHARVVQEPADRERREALGAERRAERLPAFVDDGSDD